MGGCYLARAAAEGVCSGPDEAHFGLGLGLDSILVMMLAFRNQLLTT